MIEEAEILDELSGLDGELKSFPSQAHWFCPRRTDDDPTDYDQPDQADADMSVETKKELIQDSKIRHQKAYRYSVVLGLAPEVAGRALEDYIKKLDRLLTICDKCVHNWHLGRKAYLKELSEQFDDEMVGEFSNRLNHLDFLRIEKGLKAARDELGRVDPLQRSQKILVERNQVALLALYESLCCAEFNKDDHTLSRDFDYVFNSIQTKKVLRIGDILPAMARFLFANDGVRFRFAQNAWNKMTSVLSTEIFDWVVLDVLTQAIIQVSQPSTEPKDIFIFWRGFLLLLDKMDESMIRHSLRAMEVQPDIYRLALQHLACDSNTAVEAILTAIRQLLQKAPKDFWSAMGTISPSTVADQIFLSPGYRKMLMSPDIFVDNNNPPATSWIPDFIDSIPANGKYEACRKLLDFLFAAVPKGGYPEASQVGCCRAALSALHSTLTTFISPEFKINPSTSLIVISNIMELVYRFRATIMQCADLPTGNKVHEELKRLGIQVIKDALTLDCKAISSEYFSLENGTVIQRGNRSETQKIWESLLDIFRPGNNELAQSILPATLALMGLDELLPENKKHPEKLPKDHVQFNHDFHQLMDNLTKVLQRLSDFDAHDLSKLCSNSTTARPIFAALVSSDQGVHEATLEILKATTGQDSKRDAIQSLLDSTLTILLVSLTSAVARVGKTKVFGPVPHMIKINREVLRGLCGNTGVLRAREKFEIDEKNAIINWWVSQWKSLDVVFSNTEKWAPRVNKPTVYMQDFVRDCMEYAEALFDEYSIFASVLEKSSSSGEIDSSTKSSMNRVLTTICINVNGLVGMLRLRDGYLISVITSLLGKLLRCLGEYDLEVDEWSSSFIKDACCKRENDRGFRRTNLTNQQKAELQRALEEHQGIEFMEVPKAVVVKKQGTIDAWSKSADGKQHEPKLPPKSLSHELTMNSDKHRATLEKMRAQQAAAISNQSRDAFKEKRRKEEEERKRNKEEAIAKARALRTTTVPGEGSGLKNIGGVAGKDHAPIRSEIMVGSSDEDSDEDVDETNALVKTRKDKSQQVKDYERSRQLQMQAAQGPVKKTKIQRSAKDLRARVEPNMDKLYLEILNWDIFHPGDTPPGKNECRKIDNVYYDLDLYKRTFAPLLISEVWRSLVTAKDENNFKPIEIKVLNRLSVDKFMEISTTMPMSTNRDLKMSERDIVLLSKNSDPMNNPQEPHCLARVDRTTRKKDVIEVTYRVSRDVNPNFLPSLVPNGKVHAVKIADMTTTQREYAALSSLEYYDLCSEVLEAKPSPIQKYSEEKINSMSRKYNLNRGQAQAILSANDNDGFTLIQGPPGTGKTKTIVAMVGALMSQSLQQQAEQARARPPAQGQKAPAAPPPKKKLLICAPSNAAVDELVLRLKQGVQPLNGPPQKVNVIRIGRSDAINDSVKDVMLDELVRKRMEGDDGEKNKLLNDRDKLHQEAGKIKERLNAIRPQLDEAQKIGNTESERALRREFDQLKRQQAHIGAKIDEDKESGNTVSRQNEINRRRFQQEIIDGAHILCATLSGSGHDMFRNINVEFETVIIDEAAQCIELSALIPLKYGASKCILVGDPDQLPPTVLSRSAQSFGYEQSLFVRMQKNHPKDVHLLDTQYRMHPEISVFPSKQFYASRLVDGPGMASIRDQPWHASTILGPYRFFDVKGVQTSESRGHSFINVPEINAAIRLYQRLKADYGKEHDFKGKIGVIATYKAQLNELKARFAHQFGDAIFEEIEFNTTDAFQGREREIIIFSCVRAKATGGIGFLGDIRRMNVGLTRAKSSLWVLGDSRALQQGEFWNRLIEDSKERDRYTSGDVMALFSKPTTRDRQAIRESQIWEAKINAERKPSLPVLPSRPRSSNGGLQASQSELNDSDLEMADVPDSTSRKSSTDGNTSSASNDTTGDRSRNSLTKHDSRNPSAASNSSTSMNAHGKRPREASKDGHSPPKKAKNEKISDLEAALQAQQAQKAANPQSAPRPPQRPPGMMPPRKRPAADPFIARKPPPKRK